MDGDTHSLMLTLNNLYSIQGSDAKLQTIVRVLLSVLHEDITFLRSCTVTGQQRYLKQYFYGKLWWNH